MRFSFLSERTFELNLISDLNHMAFKTEFYLVILLYHIMFFYSLTL
jgi:hypothetical protein